MKIIHVIGFFQPEYGYEEYYTALNQVKLGHEVHVITSDRIVNVPERPLKERIKGVGTFIEDGIIVHRLPTIFDKVNDFIITWGVTKKLKKINPDVVHCHGARQLGQFHAARNKNKIGYKLVVDHHDFIHPGHFLNPMEKTIKKFFSKIEYQTFRKMLGKYIFSKADRIIAVVPECKKHLIDYFNIKKDIIVNNLAVETSLFKFSQSGRSSIREKYDIKNDDFILLIAGLFTRRKRIELYIKLMKKINNAGIKLLMVGSFDKGYEQEIKTLINNAKLDERIILTGKVDKKNIQKYYSASDLGIYLANASVIWLEIMCCGIPIIGSKDSQLNYLLIDEKIRINWEDTSEASKKIKFLKKNKTLLNRLGDKSRKLVKEKFSYVSSTKRIMEVYFELLNEK